MSVGGFGQYIGELEKETDTDYALKSVIAERARQDKLWGEQNHDPFTYLAVLVEEVGELAQAALHTKFGGDAAAGLREEAVHVAAVALAIVECLDRGKWAWPIPVKIGEQNGAEKREAG